MLCWEFRGGRRQNRNSSYVHFVVFSLFFFLFFFFLFSLALLFWVSSLDSFRGFDRLFVRDFVVDLGFFVVSFPVLDLGLLGVGRKEG